MARLYIFIFVLAILAGVGYGAYFIYNDTMQRMAILRDNNAKLEVAVKAKDSTIKAPGITGLSGKCPCTKKLFFLTLTTAVADDNFCISDNSSIKSIGSL